MSIRVEKSKFKELYDMACTSWKIKFNDVLKEYVFADTVEFDQQFVSIMEQACTNEQKPIFDKLFKDYLKKDLSYEDICYNLGVGVLIESDFKFLPKEQRKKALAQHKVQNITTWFNKGKLIDWANQNQYKYYPWFEYRESTGWVFDSSLGPVTYSDGGAPGFYLSKEDSDYCGKTFIEIYKDLL